MYTIKPVPFSKSPRSGFALLITIILMAFLVLLMVSMASLTRVETQIAANFQTQDRARANAMLALTIALGKLQQAAGSDQRVTGSGDILPATHPSKKNWTGVWDTASTPLSPTNISWLVSGATTPLNTGAAPALSGVDVDDTNVRLVGAKTADTSVAGNEIIVPLQDLKAASVPGFSTTDTPTIGKFGYWIGDEGVKARVNLSDPYLTTTDLDESIRRGLIPANAAAFTQLTGFNSIDPVTTGLNDSLGKVLAEQQLDLVNDAGTNPVTSVARRARFFDVTPYSAGVLANSRDGGLQRDLSRGLYDQWTTFRGLNDYTANSGKIFTTTDNAGLTRGPSWDIIQSWANLQATTPTGANRPVAPAVQAHRELGLAMNAAGNPVQHGIGPVLLSAGFELWFRLNYVAGTGSGPTDGNAQYQFQPGLRPVIVLANPYNVDLPAAQYRISYNQALYVSGTATFYNVMAPVASSAITWPQALPGLTQTTNGLFWLHFITPSVTIKAGEALIFSPSTSGNLVPDGNNLAAGNTSSAVLWFPIPSNALAVLRSSLTTGSPWNFYNPGIGSISVHVAKHLGSETAVSLQNDLGEPLAGIEKWGTNVLRRGSAPSYTINYTAQLGGSTNSLSTLVNSISPVNTTTSGALIYTANYGFGNETNSYDNIAPGRNWLRYFNLRYNFPAGTDGCTPDARNTSVPLRLTTGSSFYRLTYGSGSTFYTPIGPDVSGGNAYWGPDTKLSGHIANGDGQHYVTLFEVLHGPLNSVGQLQHVNFFGGNRGAESGNLAGTTVSATQDTAGIAQPAYGVGSPYADSAVNPAATSTDWIANLNYTLFNNYFVSTLPPQTPYAPYSTTFAASDMAALAIPNRRLQIYRGNGANPALGDLLHVEKAAANLLNRGAFNINSTSVEAWTAVLSATRDVRGVYADPTASGTVLEAAVGTSSGDGRVRFSRTSLANRDIDTPANDTDLVDTDSRWSSGYRLTDAQITAIATQLVVKVKTNGPYASLGDFVSRRAGQTVSDFQAALDLAVPTGPSNFAVEYPLSLAGPGALYQGDILQALGHGLTARSDTFRIRVYGESRNPVTSLAESRAWAEAIVQRVPDYINTADAAEVRTDALTQPDNIRFGRRFKVVSFRWMTPADL